MDRKTLLGLGLIVSAVIALLALTVITLVMLNDYFGPGRLSPEWNYGASWANGILGFYAWTAFWLGLKLLLKTRDPFPHILIMVVMTIGVVIFVVSGIDELTR